MSRYGFEQLDFAKPPTWVDNDNLKKMLLDGGCLFSGLAQSHHPLFATHAKTIAPYIDYEPEGAL